MMYGMFVNVLQYPVNATFESNDLIINCTKYNMVAIGHCLPYHRYGFSNQKSCNKIKSYSVAFYII